MVAGRPGAPTFACEIYCATQGSSTGKEASKPLAIKSSGVCGSRRNSQPAAGETPSLTGEFVGETHRVLEGTRTHRPKNQHQKSPICLWVVGEVTESKTRAQQAARFPLGPLPHIQSRNAAKWIVPPWQIPKALPLTT